MNLKLSLILVPLVLAGCGNRTDLRPRPGHKLPVAAYGRPDTQGPRELLTPTSLARPGDSIELRIVSEPRTDDPFDLPPQGAPHPHQKPTHQALPDQGGNQQPVSPSKIAPTQTGAP